MPGPVANPADVDTGRGGCLQGHTAAVAGEEVALAGHTRDLDLHPFHRAVDIPCRTAATGFLAQHMPGLQGLTQFDQTKGIIPVSLYGQCADFDAINSIAKKHNLWVMEDGAQSYGAKYKEKKSCTLTDVATTSFFPSKPLGCYGDGGAIFTNDDYLAAKMRIILNHGQKKRYEHQYVGLNARMDTLQAAILNVKLAHFDEEMDKKQLVAQRYQKNFLSKVQTPVVLPHNYSVWAQYTIRTKNRDEVMIPHCGKCFSPGKRGECQRSN